MASTGSAGAHRIGEFARRVGVSPELLRAWEQRYGLLSPIRSAGGFRLYSDDDAARVARMLQALDQGLSAREAAEAALTSRRPAVLDDAPARLLAAIERYDEATVQTLLDDSLAAFGLEAVIGALIIPVLTQVGSAWKEDPSAVSQEHFASHLIRGRLLALARLWGRGGGPQGPVGLRAPRGARHTAAGARPATAFLRLADPVSRRQHPGPDANYTIAQTSP